MTRTGKFPASGNASAYMGQVRGVQREPQATNTNEGYFDAQLQVCYIFSRAEAP